MFENRMLSRVFVFLMLIMAINVNSSCQSNNHANKENYNTILDNFSLNKSHKTILIDKGKRKMVLFKDGVKLSSYKITIGEEAGNKRKSGDNRTPEGIFVVQKIQNSKNWYYYPTNDTANPILGAYGNWFIRLKVPGFHGIGIHGHHHDNELGNRASKGCIRLNNNKLEEVVDFVEIGIPVLIIPGKKDIEVNERELDVSVNTN